MTKEEFLSDILSHDKWLKEHKLYVKEALKGLRPYFEVERFLDNYKTVASRYVLETILADAFMDNNYELGELENKLARLLCVPFADIVEYRTDLFWNEIKNKQGGLTALFLCLKMSSKMIL